MYAYIETYIIMYAYVATCIIVYAKCTTVNAYIEKGQKIRNTFRNI